MKAAFSATVALVLTTGCASIGPMSKFELQEATVASVQQALASGALTCAQLTRLYIDRIEAYNLKGPTLRAILAVNPRAMEIAAEMDRQYKANPAVVGP